MTLAEKVSNRVATERDIVEEWMCRDSDEQIETFWRKEKDKREVP